MFGKEVMNSDLLIESEALFIINKAAKRAERIYRNSNCKSGKCSRKKLGKKLNKLYDMKKEIIEKAITSEYAELRGIHKVTDRTGNKIDLLFYGFGKHGFHLPAEQTKSYNVPYLGNYIRKDFIKDKYKHNTRMAKSVLKKWMLEYGDEEY